MSGAKELVLTAFEPALDELARRIDAGADPAETVNAALALFQGIAATAMLPGGVSGITGGQTESRWDGVFEDGRLSLLRPGYQLIATLGVGLLQTAVLNGPSCITWTILRSERGLHVTVKSPAGGTLHDLLIGITGEISDERDTAGKLRRAKAEFDEIGRRPIESLPNTMPAGGTAPAAEPSVSDIGGMLGQAAKGVAAAAAGAVLAAATGSVARAAASAVEPGKKAGPSAPPPPAPKSAPPAAPPRPQAVTPSASQPSALPEDRKKAASAPDRGPVLTLRFEDGRAIDIPSFPAVLGRSEEVEIRLDSNRVSRRHAQIESDADGFWLTDLGSANGSFRNDVRMTSRMRLENGDSLRFADIILRVEIAGWLSAADSMATMAFRMPEEMQRPQPPKTPQEQPAPAPAKPSAPPPMRAATPAAPPPSSARSRTSGPPPAPAPEPMPAPRVTAEKTPCPACGHRSPPEASFCRACGAPLAGRPTCAACGKPIGPSDPFCQSCGAAVSVSETGGQIQLPPEEPAHRPAPSLSVPGFLFGVLFTARLAALAFSLSPEILLHERVLKTIALGYGFAGMAFLTGSKGGLFRLVTLLLVMAYCWLAVPETGTLLAHVASNPGALDVVGPRIIGDVLSLLAAFWLLKRSFSFPK